MNLLRIRTKYDHVIKPDIHVGRDFVKIAICDDEPVFFDQLKQYLEKYYKSLDVIIDVFASGESFLNACSGRANTYDLAFMDIEMGDLDGITTARKIRAYDPELLLIFLTSHVEFALEGYEVDAFRFLPKPVNEQKLILTLQDVQQEIDLSRKILIKDSEQEVFIRHKDIISAEAQNVTLLIRTKEASYTIRKPLQQFELEVQSPMFYRPHRSYLINLGHVTSYDRKLIIMENGDSVPLSRGRMPELKEALLHYVKTCGR